MADPFIFDDPLELTAVMIAALRRIIVDEAEDQHDRHHQGPRDTCPEGICLHAAEQRHELEVAP